MCWLVSALVYLLTTQLTKAAYNVINHVSSKHGWTLGHFALQHGTLLHKVAYHLPCLFKMELIGVTLVNKIIQVSGAQFINIYQLLYYLFVLQW